MWGDGGRPRIPQILGERVLRGMAEDVRPALQDTPGVCVPSAISPSGSLPGYP